MKKILAWPAPLLQKWLLSLLLCLPFLAAAIVSAFSGDRTFLILSALLLLFAAFAAQSFMYCLQMSATVQKTVSALQFPAFHFSTSAGLHCKERTVIILSSVLKRTSGYLWGKPIGFICRPVRSSVRSKSASAAALCVDSRKIEIDSICIVPDASENQLKKSTKTL